MIETIVVGAGLCATLGLNASIHYKIGHMEADIKNIKANL